MSDTLVINPTNRQLLLGNAGRRSGGLAPALPCPVVAAQGAVPGSHRKHEAGQRLRTGVSSRSPMTHR